MRIANDFRDAPYDLAERDSKPVIEPRWSVPLAGIAQHIGRAVASGDLGSVPVATPIESPTCMQGEPGENRCRTP